MPGRAGRRGIAGGGGAQCNTEIGTVTRDLLLQPWPGAMSVKELSAHIFRDPETVLSRVKLFAALG